MLAAAVALGLALQRLLGGRLEEIQALAAADVVAARRELAFVLRAVGGGVFGFTALVGASLLVASRKALATGVFPRPPPTLPVWSPSIFASNPVVLPPSRIAPAPLLELCRYLHSLLWPAERDDGELLPALSLADAA